ncbi:MAG TPA: nucleotidyltransferase family protein [Thermomicrobiales bacterium]|nr:nucleotidyltransferase family protein [Thermomicrobiales bacterium]
MSICLAAGDLSRSLPSFAGDWDELFGEVCRNGLLGLTNRYLAVGTSASMVPDTFRAAVEQGCVVSQIHMRAMYYWIFEILRALSDADIEVVVLKGPALAHSIYPSPGLRVFGDLDLMVRERDMLTAHAVLTDHGLLARQMLDKVPPKLTHACTTYELVYRDPASKFVLEMHYDDLLNAGLVSRDLDGYWNRSVLVTLPGAVVRTLSLEDHLLHLCAHTHYHGYVKLNWFSDIAFIVRDRHDELDWDQFVRVTRREEAKVAVFYSLTLLEKLFGIAAPRDVIMAITPDRFRQWAHTYFVPMDRVLGPESMPRPDFSFYHLPVLKRLLPDLLVMGRRREKVRYLLRLLAPPPAWLRSYYQLGATQPIAGHYILHPLKLGWHLGTEIAAIPRRNGPWWHSHA